jgi:hypothetical protein
MREALLRLGLAGLAALVAAVLLSQPAGAQVPPLDLPSEVESIVPGQGSDPDPDPQPEPSPTPSEQPSRQPPPSPTGQGGGPSGEPTEFGTFAPFDPVEMPSGGVSDLGGFEQLEMAPGQPAPGAPAPEVAPGGAGGGAGGGVPPADTTSVPTVPVVAGVSEFAAALPGVFGLTALAALVGVGILSMTFNLTDRGMLLTARTPDGGTDVETTRRWRVLTGIGLLAAAGIVGLVGYLRISLETLVPVQLVYLASAGFAVVVLAAAGGALLISEQLRADEGRMRELEQSLAMLADRLAPTVAEPPRLLDRSEAGSDEHVDA